MHLELKELVQVCVFKVRKKIVKITFKNPGNINIVNKWLQKTNVTETNENKNKFIQ